LLSLLQDHDKKISKPILKPTFRAVETLAKANALSIGLLRLLAAINVSKSMCKATQQQYQDHLISIVANGIYNPGEFEEQAMVILVCIAARASLRQLADSTILDMAVYMI